MLSEESQSVSQSVSVITSSKNPWFGEPLGLRLGVNLASSVHRGDPECPGDALLQRSLTAVDGPWRPCQVGERRWLTVSTNGLRMAGPNFEPCEASH